jgi:type IV pilus assembly protein PilY1
LSRSDLVNDVITSGQDINNTSLTARITTPSEPVQYGQSSGWYIDLGPDADSTGERVISNAVVINNTVFFSTYIPSDACNSGGSSWFMFVNAADGGYPNEPIINLNNDLVVNESDLVTLSENGDATAPSGLLIEGTLGTPTISFGTGQNGSAQINTEGGIISRAINLGGNDMLGKRLSWRELRAD